MQFLEREPINPVEIPKSVYAILDIETTGGQYNEEGITEIAIYRFDGHKIVDQFSSLINPEMPIQPFVVNLTGINNAMLQKAPKFYEVAKRIVEITEDCVLVAHNALFDNRILTTEFDRLGYKFERETICTVELSRKLLPDMPSYSLGKLVNSLGIPLTDRHRARGDAQATVALFKLLLEKDNEKEIIKQSLKKPGRRKIQPRLLDIIEPLPADIGLYYIHNEKGDIIYVGESTNIRKSVTRHFTGQNRKSKRIQREVRSVSYEKTGNKLIAQLKKPEIISRNNPQYNPKRISGFTHQLTPVPDSDGKKLLLEKYDGRKNAIMAFQNKQKAIGTLKSFIENNELTIRDLKLDVPVQSSLLAASVDLKSPSDNTVKSFLEKYDLKNKNILIIDKGRRPDERSLIWINRNIIEGYGFYNLNFQIHKPEVLKSIINPVKTSRFSLYRIQNYLLMKKELKIIPLDSHFTY